MSCLDGTVGREKRMYGWEENGGQSPSITCLAPSQNPWKGVLPLSDDVVIHVA